MTSWQVQVISVTSTPLTEDQRKALTGTLPGFVVITDDSATRGLVIAFSIEATTKATAVRAASQAITSASREVLGETLPFLGIRVGRGDQEPVAVMPELLSYHEIALVLGNMSRQRARELAETHEDFPAPITRLAIGPIFTLDSVQEFAQKWERRSGRPKST